MKSAYPGYPDQEFMYSFNPCISFTLGPSGEDDDCQTDVAVS